MSDTIQIKILLVAVRSPLGELSAGRDHKTRLKENTFLVLDFIVQTLDMLSAYFRW